MSFLDDFSFAKRPLTLQKTIKTPGKYGENIKEYTEEYSFDGIISQEKKQVPYALDSNQNLIVTEGKYVLRVESCIEISKGDKILSEPIVYEIESIFPWYWEGEKDHLCAILKVIL